VACRSGQIPDLALGFPGPLPRLDLRQKLGADFSLFPSVSHGLIQLDSST
jgi:hypothetical protein